MITIITGTKKEYEEMMEFAQEYICRQIPFRICGMYGPGGCDKCYKNNHVKCGINVFRAIDDNGANEL